MVWYVLLRPLRPELDGQLDEYILYGRRTVEISSVVKCTVAIAEFGHHVRFQSGLHFVHGTYEPDPVKNQEFS
jgi:hypothetical protein